MKNTGIVYSSTERVPTVLPELAGLLPPLTGEQVTALETDILQNGCYSPVIVNEDLVIIDGHNRQALCEKHSVPYRMMVFHFDDMLEAMRWAVETQKARRNLNIWELAKIALKLKPTVETKARARQQEYYGNQYESGLPATLPEVHSQHMETRKELADTVGIGERTMGKAMRIDDKAPQVVKDALDNREISINQGYNITRQLQELPEEEREQAAEIAVAEEKMKRELRKSDAEIDRRAKIAGTFCKAFEKSFDLRPTEENIGWWVSCCRMRTREIKHAIDEARELSRMYASIEQTLRKLYPEAADALDEEDRSIAEEVHGAGKESGTDG